MELKEAKLVIWDMDETFWRGTLTESGEKGITIPEKNIEIVKILTSRGIINSISSKNNFDDVSEVLKNAGIWNYFVFPKINWESKGQQVKTILEECGLRPQNTVFIDDNHLNLEEAKYYCPGITAVFPTVLDEILEWPAFKGKNDENHSRLKQYQLLEKKGVEKSRYTNNLDFLLQSNIKVEIFKDCTDEEQRIYELIQRTNQLNYTKNRIDINELHTLLMDPSVENGYIKVSDKYGDYGIVGFYSIKNHELSHFLFSCRTIGMGIEQYVYSEIGFPKLVVKGEVINHVNNKDRPDWINLNREAVGNTEKETIRKRILIKGGCDLEQILPYLKYKKGYITTEFNYRSFHKDHTCYVCGCNRYEEDVKRELINGIPFVSDDFFDTEINDSKYDVVVYSVLMDYVQKIYFMNDNPQITIAFGDYSQSEEETIRTISDIWPDCNLSYFVEHFSPKGKIDFDTFKNDLEYIRGMIPEGTLLIIINGAEVVSPCEYESDRHLMHREMNAIVDEFIKNHPDNTALLDVRKFVTSSNDLADNIRHYNRDIYFKLAKELAFLVKEETINVSQKPHIPMMLRVKRMIKKMFPFLK